MSRSITFHHDVEPLPNGHWLALVEHDNGAVQHQSHLPLTNAPPEQLC